ncbi:MAG: redoxin domain-containing protein [Candidatus Komeilibacteria bacterium]|nr:redoxin domain-containing protein [Candidatus Komeilibacteria bacterium]
MKSQQLLLVGALILIVGAIVYLQSQKVTVPGNGTSDTTIPLIASTMTTEEKAKKYERAKEISTPDGFINTDAITISGLIGKKVILVDFWTYSCINCQRTTPYLNAWYDKYKDDGLEIIGVHTPEFEFEKKYGNVQQAVTNEQIAYPVVLDNDYSTWQAYGNRYWPRKYLIDIDGFIVYDHIGEGAYEETEQKIQAALAERMTRLGLTDSVETSIAQPEGTYDPKAQSPEIYFGASRNQYLGNGSANKAGVQNFTAPKTVTPNTLYLSGTWDISDEFAQTKSAGAAALFQYTAQKVYMVASGDSPVKVTVLIDGTAVGSLAGADVDPATSTVTIHDERLYSLIDDPGGLSSHTLELIPETPGLQAFTFTFG